MENLTKVQQGTERKNKSFKMNETEKKSLGWISDFLISYPPFILRHEVIILDV